MVLDPHGWVSILSISCSQNVHQEEIENVFGIKKRAVRIDSCVTMIYAAEDVQEEAQG